MIEFGVGVVLVGVGLAVWCSPQRDAMLWRLPRAAQRLIAWLTGYELVQQRDWRQYRAGYEAVYEWRKAR